MTDPKLVISEDSWNDMTFKQQAKITYDTVISMRTDVINLSKKVDILVNSPLTPCAALDARVKKLEKWKVGKMVVTAIGSIVGGIGGAHLPK